MRKKPYPPGIRKERNGNFCVRVKLRGIAKRHYKVLAPGSSLEDAKEALAQLRADLSRGVIEPSGRQGKFTLTEMLKLVETDHAFRGRTEGTVRCFKAKVPQLLEAFGAETLVRDDLRKEWEIKIRAYQVARKEAGEMVATTNTTLAFLRRGFSLALDGGYIGKAPRIELPDPQKRARADHYPRGGRSYLCHAARLLQADF